MQAMLFHPVDPAAKETTPEARIASIAMHAYFGMIASGTLHREGHSDEYIRERFFSSMARALMAIYPGDVDGFDEIYAFAEEHGLQGEVLVGGVN